jgi:uncharacterized cupredoxin-like copper-binding protein
MRKCNCIRSGAATIVLTLAMLFACGGSYGAINTRVANTQAAAVAAAVMTRVTATESEFRIVLSRRRLVAGSYQFVAVNKGKIAHSLEINGPGVSHKRIAGTILPGQSKSLIVKLSNGSYEIFCPVDGHKALGMNVKITVGGGTLGAATSKTSTSTTTTTTPTTTGGYHY